MTPKLDPEGLRAATRTLLDVTGNRGRITATTAEPWAESVVLSYLSHTVTPVFLTEGEKRALVLCAEAPDPSSPGAGALRSAIRKLEAALASSGEEGKE